MNNLMIFENNQFGKVRVLVRDDRKIYFVAKDVASVLKYKDVGAMYRRLSRHHTLEINPQKLENTGFSILNQTQLESNPNIKRMKLINESGLYKAIFGSELSSAIDFQDWVVDDVLPSIRETGEYSANNNRLPDTYEQALLEAGRLTVENKEQKQLIADQEEKIEKLTIVNNEKQEEIDRMQATCAMPRKHVVKDIRSFKNQFLKDSVGVATHRNDVYRAYVRTRWNRDVQPPISMFEDIMYSLGYAMRGEYWVDTIVLTNKIR